MLFENWKFLFLCFCFFIFSKEVLNENILCKQELLLSYGFQGFHQSQTLKLEMCPSITESCCRQEDQIQIFQNWIIDGEDQSLTKRLDYYYKVYENLISQLQALNTVSESLLQSLSTVQVSNCKILASKLTDFNIQEAGVAFLSSLQRMFNFYKDSVKGLYCTLCDATQQQFFDESSKTIIVNEKFSRQLLENSLSPLLYMHIHFINYLNLSARFLQNCNAKGKYRKKEISQKLRFGFNPKILLSLNKCKKFRNDALWLNYCREICNKFHPVKLSKFFISDTKKINNFTAFLKQKVNKFQAKLEKKQKKEAQKTEKKEEKQTRRKRKRERILQEKAKEIKKTKLQKTDEEQPKEELPIQIKEFGDQFDNDLIIQSSLNSVQSLEDYNIQIKENGINFNKNGKETIIDDKVILLIKNNNKKKIVEKEKKIEEEQQKKENETLKVDNTDQKVQAIEQKVESQETKVPENQEPNKTAGQTAENPTVKQNHFRILQNKVNQKKNSVL